MTDRLNTEILEKLLDEVESYLPVMSELLSALREDGDHQQAIEELHRLSHTINGASSMVDLQELSNTAATMENALENVIESIFVLDQRLIDRLGDAIQCIAAICSCHRKGEAPNKELSEKIKSSFQEFTEQTLTEPTVIVEENDQQTHLSDLVDMDSDESLEDLFGSLSNDTDESLFGEESTLFESVDDDDAQLSSIAESKINVLPETSDIDEDLLQSFHQEAEEHLENINNQLNILSATVTKKTAPSDDHRKMLHSLTRSVHTLKGAAAVIGLEHVAAWGHNFEDFLDRLYDESIILTPELISVMLDSADILEKIAFNPSLPVDDEIRSVQSEFQSINLVNDSEIADEPLLEKADPKTPVVETTHHVEPDGAPFIDRRKKQRSSTLRVKVLNIDTMIG